jgi:glucosamine--fructose-6-phosphate aminotransferase (isomerizing)
MHERKDDKLCKINLHELILYQIKAKNMCGIIGAVSKEDVIPLILNGLKRVEYRGYDSAGIVVFGEDGFIVRKGAGRISEVEKRFGFLDLHGPLGLGHTRWATHGKVSDRNAHPHLSCNDEVAVVHNGIIENYVELKGNLMKNGHRFKSETDTEVIAHLLEEELRKKGRSLIDSCIEVAKKIRGQYAIAAIFRERPDLIIALRKDAPLVVGIGKGRNFIASDALAFIEYTDRAIFLDNMEIAEIGYDYVNIYRVEDGKKVTRNPVQLAWEVADVTKMEHAHFTLKEIHEQPLTVKRAYHQDKKNLHEFSSLIVNSDSVFITGAGTSYHAAMLLAYRLRNEARIRCETFLSGEFRQYSEWFDRGSVVIAISQSGETADVLEAVREAKKRGAKVLSIVNSVGSSLARESDMFLPINCGPEIGVAATKSFTSQLIVSNIIVDDILSTKAKGNEIKQMEAETLSLAVRKALETEEKVKEIVSAYKERTDFYFVARGYSYPVALEGALKLKELSYIHAEGMPASELKHGTLALIEDGTPVVVINPSGEEYDDTISNVEEMVARGAHVIGVSDMRSTKYTHYIEVPRVEKKYMPVVEVIPLQLLAYYMAVERQKDPDYPRNLAKSVTVK